jgi:hypothetical protein
LQQTARRCPGQAERCGLSPSMEWVEILSNLTVM